MLTSDCETDRRDGVTLVTVVVTNAAAVARTVRIESLLDGPTWPPRRRGVPEAGWDDDVVERVVPAEGRVAVGFATPAPPTDRPVAVRDEGRAPDDAQESARDAPEAFGPMGSPTAVRRELGDPTPPRAAIPDSGGAGRVPGGTGDAADESDDPDAESEPTDADPPPAVADWLDAVASRHRVVERAAAATTLDEATEAVATAGSLAALERAVERVPADVATLRAVERRAGRLADAATGDDGGGTVEGSTATATGADRTVADAVPLDVLRRLA